MPLRALRCRATSVALSLSLLPVMGCSWLSVTKPPSGPLEPTPPVECTSFSGAPTLDWIGAIGFGIVGGFTVAWGASPLTILGPNKPTDWGIVAAGVGIIGGAVALGFSGAYGSSSTSRCGALKETQLLCTSGLEEACRSLREGKPYIKPTEREPQQQK